MGDRWDDRARKLVTSNAPMDQYIAAIVDSLREAHEAGKGETAPGKCEPCDDTGVVNGKFCWKCGGE